MSRLRYTPGLLASVAILALAGCGGGGDSTTSTPTTTETTPTLTKAELISQGDAICAEVNAAVGSVGNSETEVPDQITQVSSLYIGMVERLKGLGEPAEKVGYSEFIAAADALGKVEGETKLAAERADTTALGEAATEAAPTLEEFQTTAAAYGFEECSEGPSVPTASGAAPGAAGGEEEIAPEAGEELEVEPEAEVEAEPEVEEVPEGGGTGSGGGAGGEAGGGESSGGIGPG